MKVLELHNIKIPSINNKFGYNPKINRLYVLPEYNSFKNIIKNNVSNIHIEPPYSISILFSAYIDIDNPIKPTLDALQESGIIDNDKNIIELSIIKSPIKRGQPGSISIYIETKNT